MASRSTGSVVLKTLQYSIRLQFSHIPHSTFTKKIGALKLKKILTKFVTCMLLSSSILNGNHTNLELGRSQLFLLLLSNSLGLSKLMTFQPKQVDFPRPLQVGT